MNSQRNNALTHFLNVLINQVPLSHNTIRTIQPPSSFHAHDLCQCTIDISFAGGCNPWTFHGDRETEKRKSDGNPKHHLKMEECPINIQYFNDHLNRRNTTRHGLDLCTTHKPIINARTPPALQHTLQLGATAPSGDFITKCSCSSVFRPPPIGFYHSWFVEKIEINVQ